MQEVSLSVLGGCGELHILWRPLADGWMTTISLCNTQELPPECNAQKWVVGRNECSLFEVELRCTVDTGEVGDYPRVDRSLLSEEEQELELLYKDRRIFAVGHGAAADWRLDNDGRVAEIWADFMPAVEVPQVKVDVSGPEATVLDIDYLAALHHGREDILVVLDRFVSDYGFWVQGQKQFAGKVESDDRHAANRITARMAAALARMEQGVALLRSDHRAARAFGLANRAMLDQMRQHDLVKGTAVRPHRWRPFQLAFLLMVMESIVNEDSRYRDVLDLIWFPTGGGKTEAYLGLIAFLIIWRRLKYQASGGGTTVVMRYTLRLLTAQQFQRATRLICALEMLRRHNPELGEEPITVGMWVGNVVCPNTFQEAKGLVDAASQGNGEPPPKLMLKSCPWCHNPFTAPANYDATPNHFHFRCTNPSCPFNTQDSGRLPCSVVDEVLYKAPPTLLLATIDKFARLAWEERTAVFFGQQGNRPPELIIQDELHLIAGALGSVAGLYEAALDTILIHCGVYPKYIASTATIRMAEQQVKRLYGRKVAVFPPPGLSCDDSYFAQTVPLKQRPGRLYVGFLAPLLDRRHCLAPLAAALWAAPEMVFTEGEVDRRPLLDAWWTLVVYHGSLKGVGSSHNSFNSDVREYLGVHRERLKEKHKQESTPQDHPSPDAAELRLNAKLAQLTSNCSPEENTRTFARLECGRDEPDCLDAVLATNMLSVGLDVSRLALMLINGQPLTTAEYIQASSRVGRSEVPGLVVINYYRDQARSLSHYENFRPYHESFYRFVEPTSVTPYTYQARRRALHAALVIAIRHSLANLRQNNQAGQFDVNQDGVGKVIEILKRRCQKADPDRAGETASHLADLVQAWQAEAERCRNVKRQLNYQAPDRDKAVDRLLYTHDDRIKGLWPTLSSMRTVENTALLKQL
jgi:hypothetical protein